MLILNELLKKIFLPKFLWESTYQPIIFIIKTLLIKVYVNCILKKLSEIYQYYILW